MADNKTTVKVSADASGYTAELDRAAKSARAFQQTQDQAAARIKVAQQAIAEAATAGSTASARAINSFVSQMDRMAQTAGKSQAQILQMKAAQLGVTDSVSGYISAIQQASEKTHEFNLNTTASRRELMVLAHEASQGSWTKFGGSMMVLAETMDLTRLIMSPLGVAFLAAGGAAYGFLKTVHDGYAQVEEFNKAINATSGYVGLSAAQMAEMSNGLQTGTTNLKSVREAMAQVAATGAFTADSIQLATQAAIAMSSDIGIGTDKAAESLAKIQDDVLKWVAEYQKAHHTFSAGQIEEIDNFVKLGDTASAVKVIMQDLSKSHAAVEADANKHMGVVVDWWNQLTYSVTRAKNAIMGIGVPDSIDKQVGDQYAKVEAAERNLAQAKSMGAMGNLSSAQELLDKEKARLDVLRAQQGVINTQQRAREALAKGGDAKVAVDSYLRSDKYASPGQKHSLELGDEDKAFAKATAGLDKGSADYQAALKRHYDNVAKINEDYAKSTRKNGNNSEAFHGALTAMVAANQLIEAEEKRSQATLKAQRSAGLIDVDSYFQRLHDIQAKAVDEEIANAQKRVDLAKAKPESSAYQEALKTFKELTAQRKQIDQTLTDNLRDLAAQRSSDITRFAEQQSASLRRTQAAQQQAYATMFLAPDAKAQADAAYQLLASFEEEKDALRKQYDSPTADQTEYQAKLAIAQSYYDASLAQLQADQAKQMAVRRSYADQIRLSMVGIAGVTLTNAEVAGTAFSTAFGDMNTALEEFVTTGKFSFSSFASSVMADLAKIALKAAESRIFESVLGSTSFFSSGGGVGHYATGGHIVGAGSGTSDSIPAMLSNGEFVVNAASTKKYRSLLESINAGQARHFATGGLVGSGSTASAGSGSPVSVVVNNNGGSMTEQDAKDLHNVVRSWVDKRTVQNFRGQGGLAWQMKYNQI
ncbi:MULTISPECIES: phage tail length tape measure family protein [unclassified Caballeronia]|uniref:phage tail length tape measure family protein n=1 Tax=unclassified Caballeronia TaxID=2646786 RepID=UPI001F370038|nr:MULTISPECIES: phage tail length tape measure family protein [unclassified Caballeronia]MCE4541386.1 phage tail length tape measure family protein [Caballeronia sp. PC1]MCE4569570.1 phage tail length tape measure family protein [Caballeronia sp. CLC5]